MFWTMRLGHLTRSKRLPAHRAEAGVGPLGDAAPTRLNFEPAATVFVSAGYVLFGPVRRGHAGSEGVYLGDEEARAQETTGSQGANQVVVAKLGTEQLNDQMAGLAYLRRLPFVDQSRIVVAGCSYGGIQAMLGAEKSAEYRAVLSISPAALSWEPNPLIRERLLLAVQRIKVPVMLLQPPKDRSLEPSRVLGAEFRRLGKPFSGKIYPAEGRENQQGHCFGGAKASMSGPKMPSHFLRTRSADRSEL
jgi:carboxymethylenebutenolidase